MNLTILVSLLLLPIFLFSHRSSRSVIISYYDSLRNMPYLDPQSRSLICYLRYHTHRFYYYYLVTGPGYVLEPEERMLFDAVACVIVLAVGWFLWWLAKLAVMKVMPALGKVIVEEFGLRQVGARNVRFIGDWIVLGKFGVMGVGDMGRGVGAGNESFGIMGKLV